MDNPESQTQDTERRPASKTKNKNKTQKTNKKNQFDYLIARFLAFCVVFRRSLFVILAIVLLSVLLRFTTSDYPFSILDLRLLITPLVS
jgi:hypothetical protein